MRWETLLESADPDGIVDTRAIREGRAATRARQVSRWVVAGRLTRLRRGLYVVNAPYRSRAPHPFRVAARLLAPSYVSGRSALAFHGVSAALSPEVRSITTRRTARFDTPLGAFRYQVVKPGLFRDFMEHELSDGQVVRVASPEKALVDLLYLAPAGTVDRRLAELDLRRAPGLSWGRVIALVDDLGLKRPSLPL